jgi:CRISPR-associated exonuclease Cas4
MEQLWAENRFTAEGEVLHERVHSEHAESRRSFRQEYGMGVRSLEYGLTGKCDLVEMWLDDNKRVIRAQPVEFKRGHRKINDVDNVQLCAQVICLREMLGIEIPIGQFYYLQEHRRSTVDITQELREKTIGLVKKIHSINASNTTPKAVYDKKKCDSCSLIDLCMPKVSGGKTGVVEKYIQSQLTKADTESEADNAAST